MLNPYTGREMRRVPVLHGLGGTGDDVLEYLKGIAAQTGAASAGDLASTAIGSLLAPIKEQARQEVARQKGIDPSQVTDLDILGFLEQQPTQTIADKIAEATRQSAESYKPIVIGGFLALAAALYFGLRGRNA